MRLHELQIENDSGATDSDVSTANVGGSSDSEIIQLKNKILDTSRQLAQLNERFKKINIVNDQVKTWCHRVYNKFGVLTEDPLFQQDPSDIVRVFSAMESTVTRELAAIKARRDEEGDQEGLEFGEVFTDFATDEFLTKNIRVRPVSGMTHGDETRDGRQSNISKGAVGEAS